MKIKSPCVEKCQLDAQGKFCLGCFRYLEEISGWETFSEEKTLLMSLQPEISLQCGSPFH